MSSSGTYSWALTIRECFEEAFERCGITADQISANHTESARRSCNLLFVEWQNKGIRQWWMEQDTITLTDGDATPALDVPTLDIIDMVLRRDGVDTPMEPVGREEYLAIPDKDQEGRPDRFWLDRQQTGPVLTLWPVPENSTDIIVFNRIRRAQDVASPNAATGSESPDVPHLGQDALIAGLAMRLALKYSPERYDRLKGEAKDAFALMAGNDRQRASTSFRVSYRR